MRTDAAIALGAGLGAAATLLALRLTRRAAGDDDDSDDDDVDEVSSEEDIAVDAGGIAAREALGWTDDDAPLKMLLCVNSDLRDSNGKSVSMTKGKACAQCGHATLGAYRRALTSASGRNVLRVWLRTGQMKIAVKVPSQDELMALQAEAARRGLVCCLIRDAGHTQIAPGSRTVLAIGPAPERYFSFTQHLKLL